jgi:hypothetical protein
MADVKYIITVDDQGAVKKVEAFDKAIENVGQGADKTGGILGAFKGKVLSMAAGVASGQAALGLFEKATRLAREELNHAVRSASEAERVDRGLKSALEITGRAAGGAAERYDRYAKSLQRQTIYGDEAIKKTQTLLVQLTQLNEEGINKATQGSIGLAAVLGVDLETAATMVAKAMEGNYQALGRYGIKVDETLSAGEKQAALLEKLFGYYKRAQDDTQTYAGRVAQLKESYDDLLEKLGDFVVKNKSVIDSLGAVKSILDWLAVHIRDGLPQLLGALLPAAQTVLNGLRIAGSLAKRDLERMDRLQKEGKKSAEELWSWIVKNADAAKVFGVNLGPVIKHLEALRNPPKPTELEPTSQLLKDLGIKTVPQLNEELANAEQALALFVAGGGKAPGVISALEKRIEDLRAQLYGIQEPFADFTRQFLTMRNAPAEVIPFKLFGDFGPEKAVFELTKLPPAINRIDLVMKSLALTSQNMAPRLKKPWQETASEISEVMQKVKEYSSQAFSQLDAIFAQSQRNREIAIENEYKTRLKYIEANITDEAARQRAIEALEAEFEIKRTSARRSGAKAQKAISLMEAITNTAAGVAGALSNKPWTPFNFVLAAMTAALGAAQVATIAAQPIPLAGGAYFKGRTLLSGLDGRPYLVDEVHPGRGEITSPVPMMRQIVREESRGGGGIVNIEFMPGAFVINAQTLDDAAIAKARTKLARAVADELRLNTQLRRMF